MDEAEPLTKAIEERLWTHTIGIINLAREQRGPDPLGEALQAIQRGEAGTSFAGTWGKHHFLGTAKHVLESAEVKDLLFFPRNVGDLRREDASQIRMEDVFEPSSLRDSTAIIHRCEWEDLALIAMPPDALSTFIEFFDMRASADPAENDPLIGMGYPLSSKLILQNRGQADPIERAIVLSPTPFSGVVLPASRGKLFKNFDPDHHFLMEYDPAKDGHHPSGISGAAVWTRHERRQDVWSVTVEFAGVCSSCYRDGKIEQVIRASSVCRFLREALGERA